MQKANIRAPNQGYVENLMINVSPNMCSHLAYYG